MQPDRYLKAVLTVIAACLVWICLRDVALVDTANAYTEAMDVRIVDSTATLRVAIEAASGLFKQAQTRVTTGQLNRMVEDLLAARQPMGGRQGAANGGHAATSTSGSAVPAGPFGSLCAASRRPAGSGAIVRCTMTRRRTRLRSLRPPHPFKEDRASGRYPWGDSP